MSRLSLPKRVWMLAAAAVIAFPISRAIVNARLKDEANLADAHEALGLLQNRVKRLSAPEAVALVNNTILEGSDGLRYAAVDIGEHLHDAKTIDAVKCACEDPSAEVRKRALNVLVQLDRETGFAYMLRAIKDEDSWVRDDAAFQLESLTGVHHPPSDTRAIPVVMNALNDDNDRLTPILITVLRHLTHNPWKCSSLDPPARRAAVRAQWQAWWRKAATAYAPAPAELLTPLQPGKYLHPKAPSFRVKDTHGNTVDLNMEPYKGKVVLINFYGTWCPPCAVELPSLEQINRVYQKSGVALIGIAGREGSKQTFDTWVKLHGVAYTQVINEQAELPETLFGNVTEVPVSFLIDRQGRICRRWDGERDFRTFDAAIKAVLSEQ